MPRQEYQSQLEELREDVLYMSEVVLERLRLGLDALEQKDEALAEEVIEGDDEVNEIYLELEQECVDLLALQQPVAGDLRFIAATFKVITDLERIADLATNLGRYAQDANRDVFPDVDVQAIGDEVAAMVVEAMGAYDAEDAEACRRVAARDDDIDALCRDASESVVRDLIESEMTDATEAPDDAEIEALMQDVSRLLLTIRDLERVGDHAVNVAARALYMVESDDSLIY
jgi:phosphate transport system protein